MQLLSNAGILAIIVLEAPGDQGATVAGTQGIGVNTPNAAAVAAATSGFEGDEHIPKVGMFTIGLLSIILAAGILLVITLLAGNTTNGAGATPNEQVIIAPIHTCSGIFLFFNTSSALNLEYLEL